MTSPDRRAKPRLFTVLPRPPHPTRDGLAIRNYHLLAALAREFRVKSFALLPPHLAGERFEYPEGVDVQTFPQGARASRRAASLVASVLAGAAYSPLLYRSPFLQSRLISLALEEKPVWIVAQSYHVAPLALTGERPVWIDFHNRDSEIWGRVGQTAPSPVARAFARMQSPRVARFERDLVRRASGVSCVSEGDARGLAALGAAVSPLVVPNGVDLARYVFRSETPREEVVFFVGDLSWPPNADGIAWFRREVWPEITKRRPQARVEILGRGAPARLLREDRPDFRFLGAGADTRPHWSSAAVAIVPLLAGGGTRLKILEAAACGAPVVSTRLGAEGLAFEEESEILLRDDPGGFASAVAALLEDPRKALCQAEAARSRVEKLYGWEKIGEAFARELLLRAGERA